MKLLPEIENLMTSIKQLEETRLRLSVEMETVARSYVYATEGRVLPRDYSLIQIDSSLLPDYVEVVLGSAPDDDDDFSSSFRHSVYLPGDLLELERSDMYARIDQLGRDRLATLAEKQKEYVEQQARREKNARRHSLRNLRRSADALGYDIVKRPKVKE